MRETTKTFIQSSSLFLSKSLTFIIIMVSSSIIQAQSPFDCIDAIEVCNNDTLDIKFNQVHGVIDEGITDFCSLDFFIPSLLEENTVWMKYQFNRQGSFIFKITPKNPYADIDFIVFSTEDNNCDDITPIRCMFSGAGGEPGDTSCLGVTGLSSNSTDVAEGPNCDGDDDKDNFLAPVEINKGDVLYLAVINFIGLVDYELTHSGTAGIGCLNSILENQKSENISVYPNPFDDELLVKNISEQKFETVAIFDIYGNRILIKKVNNSRCILDLSKLDIGVYVLQLENEEQYYYEKIIRR